jgi:hypothetical protein
VTEILGRTVSYRNFYPCIEILRGIHGDQALESEAEEYFKLLVQDGLIKQVTTFHGEARYDITDEDLRSFPKDCWVVQGIAFSTMGYLSLAAGLLL